MDDDDDFDIYASNKYKKFSSVAVEISDSDDGGDSVLTSGTNRKGGRSRNRNAPKRRKIEKAPQPKSDSDESDDDIEILDDSTDYGQRQRPGSSSQVSLVCIYLLSYFVS
jgi:hypothetical protein